MSQHQHGHYCVVSAITLAAGESGQLKTHELIERARETLAPWPASDLPRRLQGEVDELIETLERPVEYLPQCAVEGVELPPPPVDYLRDFFYAELGDVLLTVRNLVEARYPGHNPDAIMADALLDCARRFHMRAAVAGAMRDRAGLDRGPYNPSPTEWSAIKEVVG